MTEILNIPVVIWGYNYSKFVIHHRIAIKGHKLDIRRWFILRVHEHGDAISIGAIVVEEKIIH